jgi:hypothetical protein
LTKKLLIVCFFHFSHYLNLKLEKKERKKKYVLKICNKNYEKRTQDSLLLYYATTGETLIGFVIISIHGI